VALAVLEVESDLDFSSPNGLRSNVSGLREWMGARSHETVLWTKEIEERGRVTITIKDLPDVAVGGDHNLRLKPSWRLEHPGDDVLLRESVVCETASSTSVNWRELQRSHLAIRDLLVLSRWRRETCVPTLLQHDGDETVTDRLGVSQPVWRTAIFPDEQAEPLPKRHQPHLIQYQELGPAGVLHWLKLREQFARALDPVITSRFMGRADAVTYLAQIGPGLEALGYLLLRRDKLRANVMLRERLDRIARVVQDVLPFDGNEWAASTVKAYNGLKHINRPAPAALEVINAWAQSVMVVRAWVAIELGVPSDEVRNRLANDPHTAPFEEI